MAGRESPRIETIVDAIVDVRRSREASDHREGRHAPRFTRTGTWHVGAVAGRPSELGQEGMTSWSVGEMSIPYGILKGPDLGRRKVAGVQCESIA